MKITHKMMEQATVEFQKNVEGLDESSSEFKRLKREYEKFLERYLLGK